LYFPSADSTWETVDAGRTGWNTEALERALTFAGEHQSTGVVILDHGRIVAERYWKVRDRLPPDGTTPLEGDSIRATRPIEDVASVQKSVVSALVGIAVERGLVRLDDPVSQHLGAGWSRAEREVERRISIRHLMSMTSGLDEGLAFEAPPGQRWFYNTPAYSKLIDLLAKVSSLEPNRYTADWLTSRIGATETRWIARRAGGPNPYGLSTTARDLARFGILVLANGSWQGTSIVPASHLRLTLQSSQTLNPSYGLLWWVNRAVGWRDWDGRALQPGRFVPTAPEDLVAARGAADRRLYVVPSLGIVVTRLGASARSTGAAVDLQYLDRELWTRLTQAIPKRPRD
jgi:CubicO group peptidase (beta-lactamase class C family)